MTGKRIIFLQKLLSFLGLEERLHLAWISSAEAQRFVQVVTEFTEKLRALGPSPIKGTGAPLRSLCTRRESDTMNRELRKSGEGVARSGRGGLVSCLSDA
jgi:hypothetical protein